jgi:hypothetical protein
VDPLGNTQENPYSRGVDPLILDFGGWILGGGSFNFGLILKEKRNK